MSLKDQNMRRLLTVVITNGALFLMFMKADALVSADFQRLMKDIGALVYTALAVSLLTVINGVIDPQTKARLVFWLWTNPLPGSRAFSLHAHRDPRVDVNALERILGKLPEDEREQNETWYRLYKSVESDPGVAHNHRDYPFTRDYATLAVLFLIILGGLAMYQFDEWSRVFAYIGCLIIQYVVVRSSASVPFRPEFSSMHANEYERTMIFCSSRAPQSPAGHGVYAISTRVRLRTIGL